MVRIALPKGRMEDGVFRLLADAGVSIRTGSRAYRPRVSIPGFEAKILKPQNVIEMLWHGSRDIGFAGADWVAELGAEVVEVLDTGLDPVRIVAAAPVDLLRDGRLPRRRLLIASEYENLTMEWIANAGLDAEFVRSYGATEVFPPEDADCIVDNSATGSTLEANNLIEVAELMRSTTRLYANPRAIDDPHKRPRIEQLALLLQSVLEARRRVMIEVNVEAGNLDAIVEILPCMREPTISQLHHGAGFAVKAAVPRSDLAELIPRIKAAGGTDIVVSSTSQIVP